MDSLNTSTPISPLPPSSSLDKSIPINFEKIIHDMTTDLTNTFPEYADLWNKWTTESFSQLDDAAKHAEIQYLYDYCVSYYPERFFDILYNNEDIFKETGDVAPSSDASAPVTLFLPGVNFKLLFNCKNISDNTRKIMWNYLQLILMTVVGSVHSKDGFGDSTKQMFEGIEETELYQKMNETMESMSQFFQSMETTDETKTTDDPPSFTGEEDDNDETAPETDDDGNTGFFEKMKGMPDIKDIYGHLKSLFDGKIGSLAKELTEEISGDMSQLFGGDESQPTSTKEVLQNLMKNPEKMTGLIKTVSEKLNGKISRGEISQDELMKEATDILGKMKGMGDSKQFQDMFKNISKMAGLGGKGKFDMNAFQQMSKQSTTRDKLKERMLKKNALKLQKELEKQAASTTALPNEFTDIKYVPTDIPNNYKFSIGDGLDEFTPVSSSSSVVSPPPTKSAKSNPKKKKNKK